MSLTASASPLLLHNAFSRHIMHLNEDPTEAPTVIDLTSDTATLGYAYSFPSHMSSHRLHTAATETVIDLTSDEADASSAASPGSKRKHSSCSSSSSLEEDESSSEANIEANSEEDEEEPSSPTKLHKGNPSTTLDDSNNSTPRKTVADHKASLPPTWTFTCDRHEDDFERDLGYLHDCGVPESWDYARIAFIMSADDFHLQLLMPHLLEIDHLTDSNQEVTEYHKEAFDITLNALEENI